MRACMNGERIRGFVCLLITMKEPFDKLSKSASIMYLLRQKTEDHNPLVVAGSRFLVAGSQQCRVKYGAWRKQVGIGTRGAEPLWAAGPSVAAGDLEILLQSSTKENNRDNKALMSCRTTDFNRLYKQEDGQVKLGQAGLEPGRTGTNGNSTTKKRLGFS